MWFLPRSFPVDVWCKIRDWKQDFGQAGFQSSQGAESTCGLEGPNLCSWRGAGRCGGCGLFLFLPPILMGEPESRNIHSIPLPWTRGLPFPGASKRLWAPLAIQTPTLHVSECLALSGSFSPFPKGVSHTWVTPAGDFWAP